MRKNKKNTEAETKPAVEEVEPDVVEAEPVEAGFFVAEGKYQSCRRGILPPGTQVYPKDFPGGEKTIEAHIAIGGLVKR